MRLFASVWSFLMINSAVATWQTEYFNQLSTCMNLLNTDADVSSCTWVEMNNDSPTKPYIKFNFHDTAFDTSTSETLSLLIERPQSETDQVLIRILQSSAQQNDNCIFFNWFEICSDRITSISTADLLVTMIHEGRQADLAGTCTFPVLRTGQQLDFTTTQNCAEQNVVQDYATDIITTLQESDTIATKTQFCNPDYTDDGDDTNDARSSLQSDSANVQSYHLAYNFQTDSFNFIKTCLCGFTLGDTSTSVYDATNPSSVALTCNYNADHYINEIDNSGFCVGDASNCAETTTATTQITLNTCGAYIQGLAPQIIFNTEDNVSFGTCEAIDSSTYAITCDDGYKTSYINNVLTYCDTQVCQSNQCNQDTGQGTCISGVENSDGTIDRTTNAFHNSQGFFCTCTSTAVGEWYGSSCQKNICVDNNINCLNGDCIGSVNDYQCVCHDGWTTPNPDSKQCSTDINECTEGTAQCDMNGTNNCVNVDRTIDSNGYVCNCKDEFTGVLCADSIDDCVNDPCGTGGSCTDGVRTTANHAYTCTCDEGYELIGDDSGLNGRCERIRQCASSPCQNGAVCHETAVYTPGANNFICNCPSGWEGDQCETDIDECATNGGFGPCDSTNTDRCINENPPSQYICVCNSGFQGKNCAEVKPSLPTVIVNFNQNFDDLAAISSLTTTDFNNLINNGFVCDTSFNGDGIYTSTDTGDALTFYNGFEWFFSGASYINSGLAFENNAGFDSSTLIAGTASYDIQCNSGNTATMKFTGTYLEDLTNRKKRSLKKRSLDFGSTFGTSDSTSTVVADVDACAPYTENGTEILNGGCLNGAVCNDQPGDTGRTCSCPSEWTGDICDVLIDSCDSTPCQNDATCINKNVGYECSCPSGFSGDNCEVDTFCSSTQGSTCVANGGTCTAGVCSCNEFGVEDTVSSTFGINLPFKITGNLCEGKDYCFDGTENGGSYSSSCGDFGTCVSSANTFACDCASTHEGSSCENQINLCDSTGLTTSCAGSNNQGTCQVIGTTVSCLCSPGYFSSDSSSQDCDLIDPCFGTNNDCDLDNTDTCTSSYVDASTGYTRSCNCLSGYSGDTCSDSLCDSCDAANTQSCFIENGAAVCVCADGFSGSDCSEISCVWGTLSADNCVCQDGWSGTNCDLKPDCGSFGNLNSTTGYCDCIDGWQTEYPDRICRVAPVCDEYGHGAVGSYEGICVCTDGWTGNVCDTPPVCNPAHSTYDSTSGKCICEDCYSDDLCLTAPNCGDHGSLAVSGVCVCTNGYSGCDCSVVPNCGDHGTLTNGLCDCENGWSGDTCGTQPNCGAHGTFNPTSNICDCNGGYSGELCSVHSGCQHGVLTNGACLCHDGWGIDGDGVCTVEPNCGANGSLNVGSSKCECDPGY